MSNTSAQPLQPMPEDSWVSLNEAIESPVEQVLSDADTKVLVETHTDQDGQLTTTNSNGLEDVVFTPAPEAPTAASVYDINDYRAEAPQQDVVRLSAASDQIASVTPVRTERKHVKYRRAAEVYSQESKLGANIVNWRARHVA